MYQDVLYQTLTSGFDLELVKKHFRENTKDVKEFIKDYEEGRDYTEDVIANLDPAYEGYSLYELDDMFCDRENGEGSDPCPLEESRQRQEYHLIEERVQIIRLIFLPRLEKLAPHGLKDVRFHARRFLRFWTHDLKLYKAERKRMNDPVTPEEERLLGGLKRWLDDIGLFVNGYLLYKLCERIKKLKDDGLIDKLEKEIWVSSFRCLAVNRTTSLKEESP